MIDVQPYIILIILWLLFGFLHSAMATSVFKSRMERLMGKQYKYYRLLYSLFNFVFLTLILLYNFTIPPFFLWQNPGWLKLIFGGLTITGFGFMVVLMRKYFFDLSGIDVFFPGKKSSGKLELGGLNRFVRHPLYSATLLFTAGFFLLQPTLANLISAASIFIYTYVGIFFEERKLLKSFGKAYEEYALQCPKLVPDLAKLLLKDKRKSQTAK